MLQQFLTAVDQRDRPIFAPGDDGLQQHRETGSFQVSDNVIARLGEGSFRRRHVPLPGEIVRLLLAAERTYEFGVLLGKGEPGAKLDGMVRNEHGGDIAGGDQQRAPPDPLVNMPEELQ